MPKEAAAILDNELNDSKWNGTPNDSYTKCSPSLPTSSLRMSNGFVTEQRWVPVDVENIKEVLQSIPADPEDTWERVETTKQTQRTPADSAKAPVSSTTLKVMLQQ